MKHATDPHWIPGIQLNVGALTYTVQDVYHTDRQFFSDTIGDCEFKQGEDGRLDLQAQLQESGRKIESNSFFYHKVKQMLQKGNVSESFLPV